MPHIFSLINFRFELDPKEQNYAFYADGFEDEQHIRYYVKMADELKQEEK